MRITAYHFFLKHAEYARSPEQTVAEARRGCAKALAEAERRAKEEGCSFAWELDDITNEDHEGAEEPYYRLWCCVARLADGEVFASLGGVDFGRDGDPWGDPYRRVVEAELALEGLPIVERFRR